MINPRYAITILLPVFLSFFLKATAQHEKNSNKNFLSGVVTDRKTKEPVAHVELFISGTTLGTITDEKGMYNLKTPFFPCTLVADHVAYQPSIINLKKNPGKIDISLEVDEIRLKEVKIVGKSSRRKNLRFFYSHFIPNNRKKIKVLNDSVLLFTKDKKEFTAFTREPLILINNLLGYRIKMKIEKFRVYRMKFPENIQIPLKSRTGMTFTQISAYYFFQSSADSPMSKSIFSDHRRQHYYGSLRHFLKAVYYNNLQEQGFTLEVLPAGSGSGGFLEMGMTGSPEDQKSFLMTSDSIRVTYHCGKERQPLDPYSDKDTPGYRTESSKLFRVDTFITILENGITLNQGFNVIGPLTRGNNRANSLPDDYESSE